MKTFAEKKKDSLETMLNVEQWTEAPISPYFTEVLRTINSLGLSDDEFFNMTGGGGSGSDIGSSLTVNDTEYKSVNAVLELIKIIYEYIKVI